MIDWLQILSDYLKPEIVITTATDSEARGVALYTEGGRKIKISVEQSQAIRVYVAGDQSHDIIRITVPGYTVYSPHETKYRIFGWGEFKPNDVPSPQHHKASDLEIKYSNLSDTSSRQSVRTSTILKFVIQAKILKGRNARRVYFEFVWVYGRLFLESVSDEMYAITDDGYYYIREKPFGPTTIVRSRTGETKSAGNGYSLSYNISNNGVVVKNYDEYFGFIQGHWFDMRVSVDDRYPGFYILGPHLVIRHRSSDINSKAKIYDVVNKSLIVEVEIYKNDTILAYDDESCTLLIETSTGIVSIEQNGKKRQVYTHAWGDEVESSKWSSRNRRLIVRYKNTSPNVVILEFVEK